MTNKEKRHYRHQNEIETEKIIENRQRIPNTHKQWSLENINTHNETNLILQI